MLANQRSIELVTLPPPPPAPPAKIDLSLMTTVAEPPVRRKIVTVPPAKPRKLPPTKLPAVVKPPPEEESSSFFLTAGGGEGGRGEAGGSAEAERMLEAQAQALEQDVWGPSDDLFDSAIDIRTAVTALKAAVERPPITPTNAAAPHLKLTQSLTQRQRTKFEPPERPTRGRAPLGKLAGGLAAPQRAGGAVEDMAAGIGELQQRMGARLATSQADGGSATLDPEGDACVSSLQSMLSAMQEMSVGAGASAGGALPQQA